MSRAGWVIAIAAGVSLARPATSHAQARTIRVVSADNQPIAFANVSVEGGTTQITDEQGVVNLGTGKRQTLTVRVMRIGFKPWFGKLELPDTAATLKITLPKLAQSLSTVTVTEKSEIKSSLALTGFYDRWLMRQKGMLSAVFISPEELEFRHPDKITNMLYGLNGVRLSKACVEPPTGHRCLQDLVAFSTDRPGCPMAIVIDGVQQYPPKNAYVDIDMLVGAGDVNGVEIYARGGNMPVNFQFQDTACGVLAFWTGSRKP
jgi:hypothetical protein